MAVDLILRLSVAGEDDCTWRDAESGRGGRGTFAAAAEAAAGHRVHVVCPGSEVLLTRVAVPVSQRSRALAAIPWALEDRLAEDVEALHFALGGQQAGGEWSVAVVARARMDDWLARLARAGIHPYSLRPEPLAVPEPGSGEWVVFEEPQHVVVRTGRDDGFACEPDMLGLLTAQNEGPERIRRLGDGGIAWPDGLAGRVGEPERLADAMEAFVPGGEGIDLLQGPYSRRERAGRQLRRWRMPALVALALLLVSGGHLGLEYAAMGEREAALRERLDAIFRQAFPEAERVADPRAQMAARLRSLEGRGERASGFADLLARTGAVVDGVERTRVTGLTWRAGTLELELVAPDLPSLDRVQRGLGEAGLQAELQRAERGEDMIEGRITVAEAGT